MFGRKKIAMVVAEFIGTFTLASVVLAMAGRTTFPFFAAAAAGSALALMILAVGSISGAHINPAVTIGMWSLRKIETGVAVVYIAAQMAGGAAAWRFNEYLLDSPLKNISGEKFDWRILIAEAVGTMIFSFAVASAVYQGYKGLKQAVTMGTGLALGILIATFASNGSLNPAVAAGIHSWSVAYVVGPIVGAIVGMNLYSQLFAPALVGASRTVAAASTKRVVSKSTRKTASKKKTTRKK